MLKLITSGKENSIYRLFHGFEDKYDGWTLDNPAVFEYIKKKHDDNNYFVSASFLSGGDDEKDYLLVFLKKNTDYFITCPLYNGEEDDITSCQMQIYDYKKKVYSNDNIGLEKIGGVMQFGPETTNGKTKLLHVVNLSKDTYCLFEIWMNEPFENSKKRVLNINFFRNIPSGGNYITRYFRDFGKIESNKWSLSGKVYARKSIRDIGRSIESEDLEDVANYEQGVVIETLSKWINFESFEEAEMVFQSEHKKIWQNVIFNEIEYDLPKIFGSGTYKTLKITGCIEAEQDEEQRFYIQYGNQNHVAVKINDVICFSNSENSDSITTDHVQLKRGMNPFVIYFMVQNENVEFYLKKITDTFEEIDNIHLFHVSSKRSNTELQKYSHLTGEVGHLYTSPIDGNYFYELKQYTIKMDVQIKYTHLKKISRLTKYTDVTNKNNVSIFSYTPLSSKFYFNLHYSDIGELTLQWSDGIHDWSPLKMSYVVNIPRLFDISLINNQTTKIPEEEQEEKIIELSICLSKNEMGGFMMVNGKKVASGFTQIDNIIDRPDITLNDTGVVCPEKDGNNNTNITKVEYEVGWFSIYDVAMTEKEIKSMEKAGFL